MQSSIVVSNMLAVLAFDNFVTILGGAFLSYRPEKNISVSHRQIVFRGEGVESVSPWNEVVSLMGWG